MRTLIVSDLHFGSASGADVLRLAAPRARLIEALAGVDRLILLGDTLELRHGPPRDALAAARPFLTEVGAALVGREVVLVPGNHDHALVDGWLRRRHDEPRPSPLALEQRIAPSEASSIAVTVARWLAPSQVSIAFPGLWVRQDVYATHGHYLDCHITVPTMERIAIGAMGKLLRRPEGSVRRVEDYEAVTAPVYAWIDAVAAQGTTRAALNGTATVRMWRALGGDGSVSPFRRLKGLEPREWRVVLHKMLRREAIRRGFPIAVAALNRAGIGPVSPDISGEQLRRAGLRAMGEVAARLHLGQAHVVFGHTHRTGPLPGDEQAEWRGRLGARLVNTGSWVYSPGFLAQAPAESPYWPGGCVVVEDEGEPQVRRLLAGLGHEQLTPSLA